MSNAQFDQAVSAFVIRLRAFIRQRVPDDATADDLTQDTLLKVYRSRASLRAEERLEAWLYRIARRTLVDYYRQRRPRVELPANLAADAADEIAAVREAMMRTTVRLVDELPEPYRMPVRLSELEGLPLAKIALRLGLSLTAVKSRVRRGRQRLKQQLQACCRFEFDRQGKVIGWERRRPCPCD